MVDLCAREGCGQARASRSGPVGRFPKYCAEHVISVRGMAAPRVAECVREGCGNEPRPKARANGPWPQYCEFHTPWRGPYPDRKCGGCGRPFAPKHRNNLYCSQHCGDVARGQRLAVALPSRVCALPECEVEFQPAFDRQQCCSELHGKRLYNRLSRADGRQANPVWSDARRDAYHRRRALKRGSGAGRSVRLALVAERDQWRCGICGVRVQQNLKWPDPKSPSIDHIVPLSAGGRHEPSNVQLAHLVCNTAKGARTDQAMEMR